MKCIISENVYNSSQKPQMLMMLENGCELSKDPKDPKESKFSEKDKFCNFLLMIQQDNTTDDDTKKRADTLFSEVTFVCVLSKEIIFDFRITAKKTQHVNTVVSQ